MTYTYKKQHVSSTKFQLKCPYTMKAEGICVHNTYNDAPAKNEASYHNSNNNQVSFHIAVDDVEAIEVVPLNRNAWAAGDGNGAGNRKHIHIEICYSKSGGDKYIKAEANAVVLIAKVLKERNWEVDKVKKHQDFSGKYCPHRILDNKDWQGFLNRIKTELDKLNGVAKPDYSKQIGHAIAPESSAFRIHTGAFKSKFDADKAQGEFVKKGYLGYAEVFGNKEHGYRLQSGKYVSQKSAEEASIKMLENKAIEFASIIGSKE